MKPRVRFDSNRREDPYLCPQPRRTRKGDGLPNATEYGEDVGTGEDSLERCWANDVYRIVNRIFCLLGSFGWGPIDYVKNTHTGRGSGVMRENRPCNDRDAPSDPSCCRR